MTTPAADPIDLLADRVAVRLAELLGPRLSGPTTTSTEVPSLPPGKVASLIGSNRTNATLLMRTGKIQAVKLGTAKLEHWRATRAAVDAYLAGRPAD